MPLTPGAAAVRHGRYAPLDQFTLSPQCGFSSTVHSNDIAVEAQRAKLRLGIEMARKVWGRLDAAGTKSESRW